MRAAPANHGPEFTLHAAWSAGPFRITHKSYTSAFRQSWHEHEQASIDFVLRGDGRGTYEGEEVLSRAGTVEYFAPGIRHRFESGTEGIRTLHVVLPPHVAITAGVRTDILIRELDASRALGPGLALLREISETSPDPLLLESHAWALLDEVRCSGCPTRDDGAWLARTRDLLLTEPERAVSLEGLAKEFGVHRAHLAREFRRRYGATVGEFGRRVRLARAARALGSRNAPPLAAIALDHGFADQAHFSRAFAAAYGCPPGRFRRRLARPPAL